MQLQHNVTHLTAIDLLDASTYWMGVDVLQVENVVLQVVLATNGGDIDWCRLAADT